MNGLISKYKGCLLGLAIGDALGTTLEFCRPGNFTPISDLVGGGYFQLKAGQWTDDTSMALCLAKSLIEKGFNTYDQMEKYLKWYKDGYFSSIPGLCVDIGLTTERALLQFSETGPSICGKAYRDTAGNGSLMRLAPVPMYFRQDLPQTIEKSGVSSKTTHAAPQAIDSCRYFSFLIAKALEGASKEFLLSDLSKHEIWKKAPLDYEVAEISKGSFKLKMPPAIRSSGYVIDTLEAAFWAFYHSDSFKEGALMAVNLGNDADTVGAVYGQLAGAFYGIDAIPREWVNKLYMKEDIELLATTLYNLSLAV